MNTADPILASGATHTSQDQCAAQVRADFALRQGEYDPKHDARKLSQAFGIPLHMLDPENPGASATAEIRARAAAWDAMQARFRARAKKTARRFMGAPPVTKAPRGKHGKRPSRNALRAHRKSQLKAQHWTISWSKLSRSLFGSAVPKSTSTDGLKRSVEVVGKVIADQLRRPSRTEEMFARMDLREPGKFPGTFTPETRKWVEENPL